MLALAVCLNTSMGVDENRIANLKALVDDLRGHEKPRVAYNAIASKTGLNAEYIYQLYTDRKTVMGRDSAKAIDRAYADGRPAGWLDQPPAPAETALAASPPSSLAADIERIAARIEAADDMTRAAARPLLEMVATRPSDARAIARKLESLLGAADAQPRKALTLYERLDALPDESVRAKIVQVIDNLVTGAEQGIDPFNIIARLRRTMKAESATPAPAPIR